MTEKLSILCFGNSLTAGFYHWGLEYHSYAIQLTEMLEAQFPNAEITIDVNGLPGDLVVAPGSFLSRLQGQLDKAKYDWVIFLGGTNDLGYGKPADKIYSSLAECWNVALSTGAKVLGLTVPECGVKSESLDTRRNLLNSLILAHQAEGFYAFDLKNKIPYHSSSESFQREMFDDGLHLTAKGYDFMGTLVGGHILRLMKGRSSEGKHRPRRGGFFWRGFIITSG